MSEPAQPTTADRAETRALAARIVEAVRADEAMPLDLTWYSLGNRTTDAVRYHAQPDVESLVFRLAQEIEMLRAAVAEAMLRAFYLYNGYSVGSRHVSGCLLDALDAVAPDIAAEVRDGADMHDLYQKHYGDRP